MGCEKRYPESRNSSLKIEKSPNSEELKEDIAAALLLCSWKHLVLDHETALRLEEDKRRTLEKHGIQYPFPNSQPHLPPVPVLKGVIGNCSTPFEKQLTESDLKKDQTRLLLKFDYVKQFLYPLLSSNDLKQIKESGVLVNVYDSKGKSYEMVFRLWGERAHVLTSKNWIRFCNDHNLVKFQDWVTVWMFKHNQTNKLCFVITSQRKCLPATADMASAIDIPERKRKCPPATAPKASAFTIPVVAQKERTKKRRRMDHAE